MFLVFSEEGKILPGQMLPWQFLVVGVVGGGSMQSHFPVKPKLGYVRSNCGWVGIFTIQKTSWGWVGPISSLIKVKLRQDLVFSVKLHLDLCP